MKRMLVRLSLLTAVVVLGVIAIAQAQREIDNPNVAPTTAGEDSGGGTTGLIDDAPGPVTLRDASSSVTFRGGGEGATNAVGNDPFADRGGERSPSRDADDAPRAPLVAHPLAAELNPPGTDAPDDEFPSAEEVLGEDGARGARYQEHQDADEDASNGNRQASAQLAIAQAPARPASTRDRIAQPSPPATLPRGGVPSDAGQPYNPIREEGRSDIAAAPDAAVDRYGRPLATEHISPTADQDPFPTRSAVNTGAPPATLDVADDAAARLPVENTREGTGIPGAKQLEGQQVPTLLIHKVAPEEIQVGRPAIFEIRVRNTGTMPAHGVEVYDSVPKGTRLMATTPLHSTGPQGALVWQLGTLDPGAEGTVSVQLEPLAEGEIGSVASVRFSAEASASTIATKPQLTVEVVAADSVMIGNEIALDIRISNTGSGVATNVIMEEVVPDLFDHVKGAALEYEIGDLQPGETREVPLTLSAVRAGIATNVLNVRADGNLFDDARNEIQVVAPAIAVEIQGPKRRFLDREATYEISINNPGTATAREIELVTFLPPGMEFVGANNQGQFDAATRAVYWLLEELPPTETGTVTLTAVPTEAGVQKLRVEGTAQQGLSDQQEREIVVEGVAAILFQVVDVEDPIEAGGETAYEVRVVNQGSKAATNVTVEAILPAEMKPLAADGPTRYSLDGQRVLFEPLPRLAPKADTTYLVRVQALKSGDLRLMVRLRTDDMQSPVTKEESTRVFSDQ